MFWPDFYLPVEVFMSKRHSWQTLYCLQMGCWLSHGFESLQGVCYPSYLNVVLILPDLLFGLWFAKCLLHAVTEILIIGHSLKLLTKIIKIVFVLECNEGIELLSVSLGLA